MKLLRSPNFDEIIEQEKLQLQNSFSRKVIVQPLQAQNSTEASAIKSPKDENDLDQKAKSSGEGSKDSIEFDKEDLVLKSG